MKSRPHHAPEWHPDEVPDGHVYASHVVAGKDERGDPGMTFAPGWQRRARELPPAGELLARLRSGDRVMLAQAITLVESRAPKHRQRAEELLQMCLPFAGNSRRIGISGIPGAGKSTFIEAFGVMLGDLGHQVAVLAVDPSSTRTGGSILGDKTRMESLSRHAGAFIRPSPSSGTLGGVAARTRETIVLVEAAGFDTVLVETVGVGQSEVVVRSMVDFFLLLQIAGAGDELQGLKKGVIEIADAIAVNKADGSNLARARTAAAEYTRILRYIDPYSAGWQPRALTCSALQGDGLAEIHAMINEFLEQRTRAGQVEAERRRQNAAWFDSLLREAILARYTEDAAFKHLTRTAREKVCDGHTPVVSAVREILKTV